MTRSFRHSAAFGKRIEFYVVGLMLKQGLDVYLPLVDDNRVSTLLLVWLRILSSCGGSGVLAIVSSFCEVRVSAVWGT